MEHRLALRRNMAQSLFEHGQIETTLVKAKQMRPWVERLITLARKARGGSLAARQRLEAIMGDRAVIPPDYQKDYDMMSDAERRKVSRSRSGRRYRLGQARAGQKWTTLSIINHLINNVAGEFEGRPGGYTRVIKLGRYGKNDAAPRAVLQLVGQEESPGTVTRPEKTARQRRAERRYAAAAKAIRRKSREAEAPAPAAEPAPEAQTGEAGA
ncbi:MAG: 50S ribosomal protein L17 [Phycisphaerae bacterium]|jgi:large subunit ribosomal protein L17